MHPEFFSCVLPSGNTLWSPDHSLLMYIGGQVWEEFTRRKQLQLGIPSRPEGSASTTERSDDDRLEEPP